MAKIKIEGLMNSLDIVMERALSDAVNSVAPSNRLDRRTDKKALYRAFKRAVERNCQIWERIPDQYIERD